MEQYEDRRKDPEMQNLPSLGNLSGTCNPLPKSEGVLSDSQMRSDTWQPPLTYEALARWRAAARELDPEWDLRLPLKRKGVKMATRVTREPRFRIHPKQQTPEAIRENITGLGHSTSPDAINPGFRARL